MTKSIQREVLIPQPPERVWQAIADSSLLEQWMFPNNFVAVVGHQFTFQVPPNPQAGFEGITVRCEVLECDPPKALTFTWSAGGIKGTHVKFRLEPAEQGTRLLFEHSGFDVTQPWGNQAFRGAEFGWAKMLAELPEVVARITATNV